MTDPYPRLLVFKARLWPTSSRVPGCLYFKLPLSLNHRYTTHKMEKQSAEESVHVKSYMHFLERSSFYDQVKPYSIRFPPRGKLPQSNIRREKHDIKFYNMRERSDLTFDTCGFEVLRAPSKMDYEDFEKKSKIRSIYLQEICEILKNRLQARHVLALDHSVGSPTVRSFPSHAAHRSPGASAPPGIPCIDREKLHQ